jgi:catechol 2,3-dioxygenase
VASDVPKDPKEKFMPVSSAVNASQTPSGLNHVVLNVRDMDEAHRFWTELLGFRQVGSLRRPGPDGKAPPRVRFYSGQVEGRYRHHDIALVEQTALPTGQKQALNHVAVAYRTLEAWQHQVEFLLARGVALHGRVDRGTTKSIHANDPDGNVIELVYELPRPVWEDDIDAALNRATDLPVGT